MIEKDYTQHKILAALCLAKASSWISSSTPERDYNSYKAEQLLKILQDLLIAEAKLESWMEDLGSEYCGENECLTTSK